MFTPLDGHFLCQAERPRTQRDLLVEDMRAAELMRGASNTGA
jgi:hypothetical protein